MNKRHNLTEEQLQELGARFKQGEKFKDLAIGVGIAPGSLYQLFLRRGLQAGRPAGTVSSVSDPHCFSDPLNNPRAAYFVGLLMADGSVSAKRPLVNIGLKETDKVVIEELNQFLGGGYTVGRMVPKGTRYGKTPMSRLVFQNAVVVQDLAKWGVVPRKTENAEALGGIDFSPHFWRGMIDGDGHLAEIDGRPRISLCGTQRICEQFATFVRNTDCGWKGSVVASSHKYIKTATINGKAARKLARVIWTPGCLSIPRKAEKAFRWISS